MGNKNRRKRVVNEWDNLKEKGQVLFPHEVKLLWDAGDKLQERAEFWEECYSEMSDDRDKILQKLENIRELCEKVIKIEHDIPDDLQILEYHVNGYEFALKLLEVLSDE